MPRAYGGAVYQNDHASSSGVAYLYDINHPIGESVEVVFETTLFMTGVSSANTWQVCNSISPLRYVTPCSGLGTQVLNVNVGTGGFTTGVTDPCSDPNRTRTDEQETQFGYGSLVDDVRIQFHPFIKWCWSGSQVAKISKYSNTYAWCDFDHPTWCDHEHFNIRPTTTDPNPFAVNGIGQYVVSFTIDVDPPPFPASNLRKQTCIYVVDRIYRANGQKEINDKLISCTPS